MYEFVMHVKVRKKCKKSIIVNPLQQEEKDVNNLEFRIVYFATIIKK
tara:strand:- start:6454 stop:6594 length:141 start_codon:yes stop_codon:yes gene_type:complete